MVHKLTLTSATNLVLNLTGLTANLDLVVLSSCNNYNAIAVSANSGTGSEQITLNNLAAGMYWIVVDAKNNATGNYNLAVNCNYTCAAPLIEQISAINITCTTAKLTANVPGAQQFDWRYRVVGTQNWIDLPIGAANVYELSGLTPGTQYEFQVKVVCANGMESAWSPSKTFTTTGNSYGSCNDPIPVICGGSYNGNNNSCVSAFEGYWGNGIDLSNYNGSEVVYKLTLAATSNVTINLSGLSANLDVFVLSACNNYNAIAAGTNTGTTNEQIVLNNLAAGNYWIVVDAKNNATSNYVLGISCGNTANNCSNPIALQCGETYNGNNGVGGNMYTMYKIGDKVSAGLTGPEVVHRLVLTNTSTVTVNLTGLSADLDLFFLSACNPNNGLAVSEKSNNQSEQLVLTNLQPGTYYVVVDGWNNAVSNYNLAVSCVGTYNCDATATHLFWAEKIKKTSADLYCSVYSLSYNWRYRVVNSGSWWNVGSQSATLPLINLTPATTYEYQVALRCTNGSIGEWSATKTFTTLDQGNYNNSCVTPVLLQCGTAYNGNTLDGQDEFINYKIGNTIYNGLNGPEGIHVFNIASSGSVTIALSGLSADLDLYLLSACDPNYALAVSENQGNANESLTFNNLAAGTYVIAVDGFNSVSSAYSLLVTCNGGGSLTNNEACNAINLPVSGDCVQMVASNVGATASATPAAPSECNTTSMKDVWFSVLIPASNKVTINTDPGTLTNAVMAIYSGANCNALTYFGCIDDKANGDKMPDVTISGPAGTRVYIRIWGYAGTSGTFGICAKGAALQLRPGATNSGVLTGGHAATDRNSDQTDEVSVGALPTLRVFPVPAKELVNVATELSAETSVDILVTDMNGRTVRSALGLQASEGAFNHRFEVGDLPPGVYVVRLQAGDQVLSGRFMKVE